MNQLMQEIRDHAARCGVAPTTIVQRAGVGSGSTWSKWQAGRSCTLNTADKARAWMAANPPPEKDREDAA